MPFATNTELTRTICLINPALCREGGQQQTPVSMTTLPNGTPQVRVGGTTLDKILTTFTSSLALLRNQPYVPTTQQPVQQPAYVPPYQNNPYINPYEQDTAGGKLGSGIQKFVTENTGVIAVGVIGYVLLMSGRKK